MIRVFDRYIAPKSLALALIEGGLIGASLFCAVRIRFWNNQPGFESCISGPEFSIQALTFIVAFQVCFYYCDLYNLAANRARNEKVIAVGQSLGLASLLLGMLYFMFPVLMIGRGVFFIGITLAPAFVLFNRVVLDRIWRVAASAENVLIFGTGGLAFAVAVEMLKRTDLNMQLSGFVAPLDSNGVGGSIAGLPVLGTASQLETVVRRNGIQRIIVALEDRRGALPIRDLVRLRVEGVRVEDAHTTISSLTGRVWLETVKPSWFVFSEGFHRSMFTLIAKRVVDLVFGILGLIVSAPLMLLVAAAIRLDSPGPIIYRQTRVGLGGRIFEVLKFRSMRTDAESGTGARWAQEQDPRVTRVGRILRNYRLDEMPQFVNVIRGDMSLVGPRPERPSFVEQLRQQISYYDERHTVRPGITGWAQVQYQYGSNLEDAVRKMEYDLFYLKNMSLAFDLIIIFDTVRTVLAGHGAR